MYPGNHNFHIIFLFLYFKLWNESGESTHLDYLELRSFEHLEEECDGRAVVEGAGCPPRRLTIESKDTNE